MREWRRALACIMAVMALTGSAVTTSYGADKKISSVTLSVDGEVAIGDEMGSGEVEITTTSKSYTVGDFEFTNTGFVWGVEDTPELEVYLYAEEGYIFRVSAGDIKLKGDGVTYVSMKKEDGSKTLILTLRLTPLNQIVSSVQSSHLSPSGWLVWTAPPGAGSYEIYLYRDDKAVGTVRTTETTSYFFGSAMGKTGSYKAKIRSVGKEDVTKKSKWETTNSCYVGEETAKALRATEDSGQQILGQWKQDHNGWWYQNIDGSYPKNAWMMIGDQWYFFYESGYMATGWILSGGKWYYCSSSGAMLVNTVTPDGYEVGADGALK